MTALGRKRTLDARLTAVAHWPRSPETSKGKVMKPRRFLRASLLFVTFFTASRLVAAQGGAAIDAILRAAVERKDVPGVVALVTNRDRVVYQGAFGVADVSTGRALTSAIWRDFKPKPGETYPFGGPLLFEPGERWHYSTSTDVVGRLVEVISGQKLEDYFRQHIFAPLKMDDTSYNVRPEKAARLVAAQQRAGERMDGAVVLQSPQPGLTIAAPIGGGGLASTASDYGRFVRMLLNGGALDGARVLKAETIALMGQNQIGAIGVPALKSALPRSADFNFIADGRDKFGLGFLITTDQVPGKRSAGSLSWGGINNTYFWVDPSRGIAGVIMMQYLPFADPRALALHEAFERAAYRLAATQPTAARDERLSPVALAK